MRRDKADNRSVIVWVLEVYWRKKGQSTTKAIWKRVILFNKIYYNDSIKLMI